jgi:hypothetical protein
MAADIPVVVLLKNGSPQTSRARRGYHFARVLNLTTKFIRSSSILEICCKHNSLPSNGTTPESRTRFQLVMVREFYPPYIYKPYTQASDGLAFSNQSSFKRCTDFNMSLMNMTLLSGIDLFIVTRFSSRNTDAFSGILHDVFIKFCNLAGLTCLPMTRFS